MALMCDTVCFPISYLTGLPGSREALKGKPNACYHKKLIQRAGDEEEGGIGDADREADKGRKRGKMSESQQGEKEMREKEKVCACERQRERYGRTMD